MVIPRSHVRVVPGARVKGGTRRRHICRSSFMSVTVRSGRSATWLWTRRGTCSGLRPSTPWRGRGGVRPEPASSMSDATVSRKLCNVTLGIPSPSRTMRHAVLKFSGSRSVPLLNAKIVSCWPTHGCFPRSLRTMTANDGNATVRRPAADLVSSILVSQIPRRRITLPALAMVPASASKSLRCQCCAQIHAVELISGGRVVTSTADA